MKFDFTLSGPRLNIDPTRQPILNHRSGWAFALEALAPLHDPQGILFDSFLERTFSWYERGERKRDRIPYREPWIGIIHNPPGVPRWHDYQSSPQAILARQSFRESLPNCVGLFTLSEYLRQWLAQRVAIPVSSLIHPTEIPPIRFSPEAFRANPQPSVIQIGWWLRRLHSIYQLDAGRYRKVMLAVGHRYFKHMLQRDRDRMPLTDKQLESVTVLPFVSNEEYDRLLSQNIVFCDLIDSSANNVIIECIARNTPLLINRLPAIEEYLGRDYPLYFSSLDEAALKLAQVEILLETHEYLRELPKERFSQQAFLDAFLHSDVYHNLAQRSSQPVESMRRPADAVRSITKRDREVTLLLRRAASGTVYIEQVVFSPLDGEIESSCDQLLRSLVCGLPLSAARGLSPNDVIQRFGSDRTTEAQIAYETLKEALDQL